MLTLPTNHSAMKGFYNEILIQKSFHHIIYVHTTNRNKDHGYRYSRNYVYITYISERN